MFWCCALIVLMTSQVTGFSKRASSVFASHCKGEICNYLLGVKNLSSVKNSTSASQPFTDQLSKIKHILSGMSSVLQLEYDHSRRQYEAYDRNMSHLSHKLAQLATSVNNSLQSAANKIEAELDELRSQVFKISGIVSGATPAGRPLITGSLPPIHVSDAIVSDCAALYKNGVSVSGVYTIQPDPADNSTSFDAFCDMETIGGGWTVIQRRRDGSEDFYRDWSSYKNGFGNLNHDFWIGLKYIHLLTKFGNNRLRFDLGDWNNDTRFSVFDFAKVSDESDKFRILAGGYRGNGGNPFQTHSYSDRMLSMRFSTFDNDNDMNPITSCARAFSSGWWFNNCFVVNPNGIWYPSSTYTGKIPNGIIWSFWHSNGYSLKSTEIKLRPEVF